MSLHIDSDVPMPSPLAGRPLPKGTYAATFRQMQVGQSFVYPLLPSGTAATQKVALKSARSAAPGRKFSSRILEEGGERIVRIWRVA